MQDAQGYGEIYKTMEFFPALAQAFLPAVGRGDRQRDQQREGQQPDAHGAAFTEVAQDQGPVEIVAEPGIRQQVQGDVAKTVHTERAAHAYQLCFAGESDEGCDRKCSDEECQPDRAEADDQVPVQDDGQGACEVLIGGQRQWQDCDDMDQYVSPWGDVHY